jgi:hypothetical protein
LSDMSDLSPSHAVCVGDLFYTGIKRMSEMSEFSIRPRTHTHYIHRCYAHAYADARYIPRCHTYAQRTYNSYVKEDFL